MEQVPPETPEEDSTTEAKPKEEEPEPEALTSTAVGPLTLLRDVSEPKGRLTPEIDNTTGALVYKYEIVVPPGRNELTPAVALVYNSAEATQDSVVGSGWSIDIPYIRRINKDGTNYLYSENYYYSSLDGELVSLGGGTYAAKDENGGFRKYSLASSTWTVTEKNGTVYKFGTTAAARQDNPSDSTKVFKWMLEEVRDTNDNFVSYEYYKDAGQIYPSKITYTGNGSTPGILEVNFDRASRSNAPARFETGFSVKSNYRISEIRTEVSDVWARKYTLAYTAGDNGYGSFLDTITESGRDDAGTVTTLPATDFSYNAAVTDWTYDSSLVMPALFTSGGTDFGMRTADINGDGLADVLCHNDTTTLSCGRNSPEIHMHTGSGWTDVSSTWLFPIRVDSPTKREGFLDSDGLDSGLRVVDVNGDLKADLVRGSGANQYVYLNNGSGWTYDSSWDLPVSFVEGGADKGMRMADINGDGLPDVLCHTDATSGTPCNRSDPEIYLNTGSGWTNVDSTWAFPPMANDATKTEVFLNSSVQDNGMRVFDINGDGLADLVRAQGSSRYVYINNGSGWTYDADWSMPISFLDGSTDTGARLTDINGDGLIDVICHNDATSGTACNRADPELYLNRGTSFNSGWSNVDSTWAFPPMVNDTSKTEAFKSATGQDAGLRALDVNGDGMDDLVRGYSSSQRYSYLNNESFPTNLLTGIAYPQGGSATITYKATPLFKNGSTLLNPAMPIIAHVVSQMIQSDGLGNSATSTYAYEGGAYYFASNLDRKFAGFSKVTRTDAAGNKAIDYLHQGNTTDSANGEYSDHASKIGKIYRTEIQDGSGNVYKKTVNKWDRYDLGSGRSFVTKVRVTELTYDGDSDHKDKAEEYAYDNTYGNLTERIEYGEVTAANDGSFTDTGTDKFTTTISYAVNTTPYIVGLPSQETVVDQSSNKVRESKYYYDGQTLGSVADGNMTKQEMWKTGSAYVDIERTYNTTYGIVTQEMDPRDKATTYSYDSYNLRIATSTNALSQATGYSYDYSSGKVKQLTDPNGRVFQTVFDGLDRVTAEKQPDLTTPSTLVTKTAYTYTDTSGAVKVQKTDHLDGTIRVDTYTCFDGLRRPIQVRKEMEDGNYAVTDMTYNNVGRVHKESVPYSSSGTARTTATTTAALLTTYSYDPMLRVTSVANAIGTTTNAYDDWMTSVTDPRSKVKHFYNDAYGNLVRVDEVNSGSTYTTTYEYNGNKKLTKITDALGNVRSFTYDGLGRRLTAEDLHASGDATYGTWTYTYDDSDNLTSTVDPKSQTINYTYDDLNRKSTEDYTGQSGTEITYTYDSGTDGAGRLTSVTAPGANTSYAYNPLGTVKQETKTINSTSYQTDYTHDRQGNLLEITNPDSSKLKYTYNTAGQLETVQRKESTDGAFVNVVTDFDYGPHEKVTSQEYADGAATTNTYDSAKMYRLSSKLTTVTGGSKTQDLAYTYDANSNITQIVDASNTNSSKTVAYAYDDLNRLLAATSTNVAAGESTYAHSYTYNAIGNILTRTDSAGTYSYAGDQGASYANPHAVTSIGSNTYTYDNNGNLLTETGGLSNTWDYNNRLTQAVRGSVTSTYAYDHEGQRVRLNNGTSTTVYPTKFYNTDGTTPIKHILTPDGQTIATVKGTGASAAVFSVHVDHLGGANVITNTGGTQEELVDYFPFGNIRLDQKAGTFGEQRKYIGQEYDPETNLSYLQARYYDGARGQFLSQDPSFLDIGLTGFYERYERPLRMHLMNPQALNSYSYALNNPIIYKDPDGAIVPLVVLAAWVAAEVGISVYDAYSTYQTLNDEYASAEDKALAATGFAVGLLTPGGGYGKLSTTATKYLRGGVYHGGLRVGENLGKIGKVVPPVPGKVTGYTAHGLEQATARNVAHSLVQSTVINPLVKLDQGGGVTLYLTEKAGVAVNSKGQVITVYGANNFNPQVKDIIRKATTESD